jgi:hypothetical protein
MRPQRVHRWVFWLLPLFAVRALIPVGFMLSPAHGSLQLVLCPAQGAVIQSAQGAVVHHGHSADAQDGSSASMHADGAMHSGAGAHAQVLPGHAGHLSGAGLHDHSVCPFALAGMAALTAAGAIGPLYIERAIAPIPTQDARLPFAPPGGVERIRGPPLV